ncbi:MAG: hypothetical protein QIT46_gp16 [Methanophagales virus PBV305]|uniref:Uncharacterized protein n=1 Tax=Methanophagales virus PBV305 TaxID=3071310 RepID=A0AA46TDM5_9VIRU|nr:MAG: hypothetical protein QIT46_gp16 [Methanophagales virus PBV305]UYL65068.1 MAG: hypothetical protein HJKPNNFO_00016 [Methanophagales virus PBV305]
MVKYYKGFEHTNSSADEEKVVTLTSTEEEPKRLIAVTITQRLSNDTLLYGYIEREKVIDAVRVEASPFNENPYRLDIDLDIPVGETFMLKLKNQSAGSNGGVVGYLEYEIKG